MLENGIHKIPFTDYASIKRVHKSHLWTLYTSTPARYKWEVEHEEEEVTPSMIIGLATHTAVLEPPKFDKEYLVAPENAPDGTSWNRRLKEHKAAWQAFEATAAGKTILTAEQEELCRDLAMSVWAHPSAKMLLDKIEPEQSLLWTDPETQIQMKGRPDGIISKAGIIIDLKTCISAAPAAFKMASYKFGYHFQAALYWDGLKACGIAPKHFYIIAVEKTPPHSVAVYEVENDALSLGRSQYQQALMTLKDCLAVNRWPGYDKGILTLPLPSWAGTEEYGGGGIDYSELAPETKNDEEDL